jgi:pentatricopeptide repeat protein
MQVFSHMKAAAKNDSACAPNVITYSALMTACCAGGRPDKAYELFRSMPTQDIRPDHICYSTLIAGGQFFFAAFCFLCFLVINHAMQSHGHRTPCFGGLFLRAWNCNCQEDRSGQSTWHSRIGYWLYTCRWFLGR